MVIALAWMLVAHPLVPGPGTHADGWVRVWTDQEEAAYQQGDPVQVFLRLDQPAYVTALRVDTDGRIRVLFPRNPWGDNYIGDRRPFAITTRRNDYAFAVDEDGGVGYILVVASPRPFDYRDISRDDYWDYRLLNGGRIRGDPYVALTDVAERISPDDDYGYDIAPYYVGRHYDYPRFVCAQCHSRARERGWDEYRLQCTRFRLLIYDDPAYYPYRYGRGRNVVVERPLHPAPRFVFRDAGRGADYITRVRGRADDADRRRARELSPARPLVERHGRDGGDDARPRGYRARDGERREDGRRDEPSDGTRRDADPRRPAGRREPDSTPLSPAPVPRDSSAPTGRRVDRGRDRDRDREPRSVGTPELRRRKP